MQHAETRAPLLLHGGEMAVRVIRKERPLVPGVAGASQLWQRRHSRVHSAQVERTGLAACRLLGVHGAGHVGGRGRNTAAVDRGCCMAGGLGVDVDALLLTATNKTPARPRPKPCGGRRVVTPNMATSISCNLPRV